MLNVLLVLGSYFNSLYVKNLVDWKEQNCKLLMEFNAISGFEHLGNLRPDILILHCEVGWMDAQEYLKYIRRMYLPTQVILLLGESAAQIREKKLFCKSEDIQVINWKALSAHTLARALREASDRFHALEGQEQDDKAINRQKVPASVFLRDLTGNMSGREVCLMRLVIEEKKQPFVVLEQIIHAFKVQICHPFQGKWYRGEDGNYCILINLVENYSTYSRVELIHNLAQALLRSVKEIVLGGAYFSICYQTDKEGLETQYQKLCELERYRFFCRELPLLSLSSIQHFKHHVSNKQLWEMVWNIYNSMAAYDLVVLQQNLQELYLHLLKTSVSFELLKYARSLLCQAVKVVLDTWKLPAQEELFAWPAGGGVKIILSRSWKNIPYGLPE